MKAYGTIAALLLSALMLQSCGNSEKDFALGADISWARSMEAGGVVFRNAAGEPRECTALMKELGLNAISLRVWVDPKPYRRPGTAEPDPSSPSYHIGLCDKEDVLAKALKVKEQGMDLLVSFHYSDTWTNPKTQPIPAAWVGHSYEQMLQDVRDHTVEVLQLLKDNGISPKWIKIGNETTNGILWNGTIGNEILSECMGHLKYNPEQYAGFINAGHEAAKSVFPEALTIAHLDCGFDQEQYDRNIGTLVANGARFDLIGMSLYPYWAAEERGRSDADGVIEDCIANIRHLYEKFGKESIIVETGYEVDMARPELMEAGRRQLAKLIRGAMDETDGHCRGVFYWEPECLPGGYNLGAFDSDARPTVIMDAFRDYAAE